jgi:hypothetical protein
MAITNLSTSSLVSGVKRRRVWDQLATTDGFFQIATTTLNTTASSITFSSIPQDYTHLHIRGISRITNAVTNTDITVTFNSDSASNYSYHALYGTGSAAASTGGVSQSQIYPMTTIGTGVTSNIFAVGILDILDYANTNKFKTVRSFSGYDGNGNGIVFLNSGNWRSTAAINTITITSYSNTFAQNCSFALYGIKG